MKVTTVGVGGAWAPAGTWNTIAVVHNKSTFGKNLLIDCGGDVRHALGAASISSDSIGAIWITHLHGDHIDGLEYFAFERYCLKKPKPILFIHEKMLAQLWKALEPKIGQFQDFQSMQLHDYFDIGLIHDEETINCQEFMLDPVTLPHINCINPDKLGNSIGVTVTDTEDKAVFFTGDTRAVVLNQCEPEASEASEASAILKAYTDADRIFQDCAVSKESVVHASVDSLGQYPEAIRKKMVLTHCTAPISPWVFSEYGFIEQAVAGATYNI